MIVVENGFGFDFSALGRDPAAANGPSRQKARFLCASRRFAPNGKIIEINFRKCGLFGSA